MNEQFYRLCFHMRRTASSLRSKLFPFSLNKILESANDLAATVEEIEEFRELDKRLQQEYEEHIRSEPVLIPQNTMYFGGRQARMSHIWIPLRMWKTSSGSLP